MQQVISKSQFKTHALELLRLVETQKQPIIITHDGKPVAKVIPYREESDSEATLKSLRGSVIYYKDPDKPAIDPEDWEVLE